MTEKEFIGLWVERLVKGNLKSFPNDFTGNCDYLTVDLPGTVLTLGDELFGSIEILDIHGNSVIMADSFPKAKYFLYASKEKPASIKIPKEDKIVSESVKSYEKYLDGFLKEIEADFKTKFPDSKNFPRVSLEIFNTLNLKRY